MKLKVFFVVAIILCFFRCSVPYNRSANTSSSVDISGKWVIISTSTSYFGGRVNFHKDGTGYCYPNTDTSQKCYFNYSMTKAYRLMIEPQVKDYAKCYFCDVLNCSSPYFDCNVVKNKKFVTLELLTPDSLKLTLVRHKSYNKDWEE